MQIREQINKNAPVAIGISALLFAVAIGFMWFSSGDAARQRLKQAFYSIDEGKTYFAEDIDRVYPFQHEGKQAFRVYVYQCGNEPAKVAYVARYDDPTHEKLEELLSKTDASSKSELATLRDRGIEVRKPGDSKWVSQFSEAGQQITMRPSCAGGGIAKAVFP